MSRISFQLFALLLAVSGFDAVGMSELNARAVSYAYDPLYRLTGETVSSDPAGSNGAIGYTFDGVGNRLSRTSAISAVPAASHSYNSNDWLASDTYDITPFIEIFTLPISASISITLTDICETGGHGERI